MVQNCFYCGKRRSNGVSLFCFPLTQPDRLKVWLKNMGMKNEKLSPAARLCSEHFESKFLLQKDSNIHLTENSQPTIFGEFKFHCVVCKEKKTPHSKYQFHRFPHHNPNVLERWVANLSMHAEKIGAHSLICSNHFESACYYPGGRLKAYAVPTIFLFATNPEFDEPTSSSISQQRPNDGERDDVFTEELHEQHSPRMVFDESNSSSISQQRPNDVEKNDGVTEELHAQPTSRMALAKILREHNYDILPRSRKRKYLLLEQTVSRMQKQRKLEKKKLRRRERKLTNLKDVVEKLKQQNNVSSTVVDVLSSIAEEDVSQFLVRFYKNSTNKIISREEYPPALRSFALTLHFYSPKGYEYVRQKFCRALPDSRTIRSWYSSINGEAGFTAESFDTLAIKADEAKRQNKRILVSLVLDEMGIKSGVQRSRNGFTRGYVTLGDSQIDILPHAKDSLMFLVVCLDERWKIPIGHWEVNGIESETLVMLINESLSLLHNVGVDVVSITLDGPAQHFAAMKKLGVSFDVENLKPYFLHPCTNNKVYAILDACHMLKLIRNCLGDEKILIDNNGGHIEWRFIENLCLLQEGTGLRAGNKLKLQHLHYYKMKMKVSLAAQTLSSSVADAIEFCDKSLNLPNFKRSEATVKFIRVIDQIFDFCNSRYPLGKGFKASLRVSNENFWRHSMLDNIKYQYKISNIMNFEKKLIIHTRRFTPFIGFISGVTAIIGIFNDYVKNPGSQLRYLLTYKFSQDHIELFFCAIRSCGGWCPNPTCMQLVSAYKRLLVRHQIIAGNGNAVAQDSTSILHVSSRKLANDLYDPSVYDAAENARISKKYGLDQEVGAESDDEKFMNEFLVNHNLFTVHLTEFSESCVTYIAGWVVKKVIKFPNPTIKCEECRVALFDLQKEQNSKTLSLIATKNRGGLIFPSQSTIVICCRVEQHIRQVLNKLNGKAIPHERNFPALLCNKAMQELLQPLCSLFPSLKSHVLENDFFDGNHIYFLIKAIATTYIQLRMFAATATVSSRLSGGKLRHYMTRQIIWAQQ